MIDWKTHALLIGGPLDGQVCAVALADNAVVVVDRTPIMVGEVGVADLPPPPAKHLYILTALQLGERQDCRVFVHTSVPHADIIRLLLEAYAERDERRDWREENTGMLAGLNALRDGLAREVPDSIQSPPAADRICKTVYGEAMGCSWPFCGCEAAGKGSYP